MFTHFPVILKPFTENFLMLFSEIRYRGTPDFHTVPIGYNKFRVGNMEVTPLPALHMKMEVLGFRIGDFSYLTDTNYIPGETLARMMDSKVIVLNALRRSHTLPLLSE